MSDFAATPDTRPSLLEGLVQGDPRYREKFLRIYLPLLYTWARGKGWTHAYSEDVAHDVAIKILMQFPVNVRDGKCPLRAYLRTMVRHAIANVFRDAERRERISGAYVEELLRRAQLGSPTAGPSDAAATEVGAREADSSSEDAVQWTIGELEELMVLADAKSRVQRMCSVAEWRAYRLRFEQGMKPADIAARLGLSTGSVSNALSKVKRLIDAEIKKWLQ